MGTNTQGQIDIELSGLPPGDTRRASNPPPGQDLRFTYRSEIDDTEQPYAVYVPSGYDAGSPWPLVVNLHGTSAGASPEFVGQTSEHYTADENASFVWAAERHGAILATPHGRGITEFRGMGEHDVFRVIEEVRERYSVDGDRISLTGLSMGGTGTIELALHHPGFFAAAAPVGAAHSFPWLAPNGQHIPFWWIGGENDRSFNIAGKRGGERMVSLGYPTRLDIREGRGHADFLPEYFDGIVEWLVQHRAVRRPRQYTFTTVMPMHGEAYWTSIDAIESPGTPGTLRAEIAGPNLVRLSTENLSAAAVFPSEAPIDLDRPLEVEVDGRSVFLGAFAEGEAVELTKDRDVWKAASLARTKRSLKAYGIYPVAEAPAELRMEGPEVALANWVTDAMRAATGADIALYDRRTNRGLPIPKGTVDQVDLIHCMFPWDHDLALTELSGQAILDILEANIIGPGDDLKRLVQVSGVSYAFDWERPRGSRIVDSDIDPGRAYRVTLMRQVPERGENRGTMSLAQYQGNLDYDLSEVTLRAALYAHAVRSGKIEAKVEGRVRAVS